MQRNVAAVGVLIVIVHVFQRCNLFFIVLTNVNLSARLFSKARYGLVVLKMPLNPSVHIPQLTQTMFSPNAYFRKFPHSADIALAELALNCQHGETKLNQNCFETVFAPVSFRCADSFTNCLMSFCVAFTCVWKWKLGLSFRPCAPCQRMAYNPVVSTVAFVRLMIFRLI